MTHNDPAVPVSISMAIEPVVVMARTVVNINGSMTSGVLKTIVQKLELSPRVIFLGRF